MDGYDLSLCKFMMSLPVAILEAVPVRTVGQIRRTYQPGSEYIPVRFGLHLIASKL